MDDLQGIFRISAQLQMPQQRHLPLDAFPRNITSVGIESDRGKRPRHGVIYSPQNYDISPTYIDGIIGI